MHKSHTLRNQRARFRLILCAILASLALTAWFGRRLLHTTWTLAALRLMWHDKAADFILSQSHDNFDVTFKNYNIYQLSAEPYQDMVPPILRHIALGDEGRWKGRWGESVQSCIDMHPNWTSYIWTDEFASRFVADTFPDLQDMWDNYYYLVQKIDALRYMLLYAYGGSERLG